MYASGCSQKTESKITNAPSKSSQRSSSRRGFKNKIIRVKTCVLEETPEITYSCFNMIVRVKMRALKESLEAPQGAFKNMFARANTSI